MNKEKILREVHLEIGDKIRSFCKKHEISHVDMLIVLASLHKFMIGYLTLSKIGPEEVIEKLSNHKGNRFKCDKEELSKSFVVGAMIVDILEDSYKKIPCE